MKYLALLISISFISFLLPVSAKEQSKSQKSLLKNSTHKKAKQHAKKYCKNISSIKTKQHNGLPNTRLDSFILNSGGLSEAIYGDEGSSGPPPYLGFGKQNRTESGIYIHGLNTENSRQYIYDAKPSFWCDWKPLTGDFDYTLRRRIEQDQVEE